MVEAFKSSPSVDQLTESKQTMSSISSFLNGGGPSAKFPTIGTKVSGTITDAQMRQAKDYDTDEPKFWPDGGPVMELVISIRRDSPDAEGNDDARIFFSGGNIKKGLADAVRSAGSREPEVGGHLSVTYVSDGPQPNKKRKPPKQYKVEYVPPADSDELGAAAVAAFGSDATEQPPF